MKKLIYIFLSLWAFNTFASEKETYLELVNDHRSKLGLKLLLPTPQIEEVAARHSRHMAKGREYFGHEGWKSRCSEIKESLGIGNLCGEIIARGQKNPHAVFRAWLNSPPHRRVIEGRRYTHTGLGFYKDKRGVINWTQLFLELK